MMMTPDQQLQQMQQLQMQQQAQYQQQQMLQPQVQQQYQSQMQYQQQPTQQQPVSQQQYQQQQLQQPLQAQQQQHPAAQHLQQQQLSQQQLQGQQQHLAASAAQAVAPAAAAGQESSAQQQQQQQQAAAPQEDPVEQRRKEDALLEKARAIQAEWQKRALGYGPRCEDPARALTHWDYLLKEAHWLAKDMGQERLWKRRAAYHIGIAAAAEGRRRLQAAAAAAAAAEATPAKAGGRGSKAAKKEEQAEQQQQQQQQAHSIADILAVDEPSLELQVDYLYYWVNNGEFTQCVIAHLENADVQRLLRIYQYSQKYEADWEVAWLQAEQKAAELMKAEPAALDEDTLAKRGKRKGPKHVRVEVDDDLMDDMGGTPTPVAMPKQAAQAAAYGRDKRKRKGRDIDDEDYVAGVKAGRTSDRRGLPGLAGAGAGAGAGGGGGLVHSGSDMSLAAAGVDPRMTKRLKSHQLASKQNDVAVRMDSMRGHGHPLAPQRSGLARAQSAALPHNWGYDDDALLAALVVEYNFNWHFIADTCSSTCALQGITRRSDWCKQRHGQIMKAGEAGADQQGQQLGPDGQPVQDPAAAAGAAFNNLAHLSKHQAKELIMRSLPVPESVLKRHADAIGPIFAKKKQQILQDRETVRKQNEQQAEPHVSHFKLTQAALNQSGGRILNPLEITEQEEQAKKQAAAMARQAEVDRQQAAAAAAAAQQQQQQAAAAAAAAAQQQAAAAAAAQHQQQQQQQQQAVGGGGGMSVGASPSLGSQGAPLMAGAVQAGAVVAAGQQQLAQQQAVAAVQAQAAQQQQAALMAAGMQQRPGTPGQGAGGTASMQGLAQRTNSLQDVSAASAQLATNSSAGLAMQAGSSQATAAAAAAAAAAVQQRATAVGGVRPGTPGLTGMAPRPMGQQLTAEQQKMMMMQQQQLQRAPSAGGQQQLPGAAQQQLPQQQQRQGQQPMAAQQQQVVGLPTAQQAMAMQVTSPSTQQRQQQQQQVQYTQQQLQYTQQQQQQLMAQRMAGFSMPGAAAAGVTATMPGMITPALAAQMAAAQKASSAQLQQLGVAAAGAPGGVAMPTVSAGAPGTAAAVMQSLQGKHLGAAAARPAGAGAMMAGGMSHAALAATQQQQAVQVSLSNPQALAQMQLLQPMGVQPGGVAAGMAGTALHPGMAASQGLMWPMQQANIAQLMQLQQQQQGKGIATQAQLAAAAAAQQAAVAAAGQQPPTAGQPSAG